jgi:hypothetical protein
MQLPNEGILQASRTGLLQQASVERSEQLSLYRALRADRVTGGKSCPLSRTGEVRFTGCDRLPTTVMRPLLTGEFAPEAEQRVDVNDSDIGSPIPDDTRLLTVPVKKLNHSISPRGRAAALRF